jgi:Ca2+-dependent lipid-binding protein
MPCILKIRITAARNLPIMDRTTELADAYVEVKFADFESLKTQICRKTLDPVWSEDFRFEVAEDADLQNEPLELKVMVIEINVRTTIK